MTSLTDRYLQAVLEHLPEAKRVDVGQELRGLIDDMVENRIEAGEPPTEATRATLTELGNPSNLARQYNDAPRYLIGPKLFPTYSRLLSTYGIGIVTLLAAINLVASLAGSDSVSDAIWQAITTAFSVGVQVLLWTTLTFAILEWAPGNHADEFLGTKDWTVDDLPETTASRQIGIVETLFNVGIMVVLSVVALAQHRSGVGWFMRGQEERSWSHLPLINPELGGLIASTFFLLVAASVAAAVVRYVIGSWTTAALATTIVEAALWVGFVGILVPREPIFNPALAEAVDSGKTWWQAGGPFNTGVLVVVIIVAAIDVWEGVRGYREAQSNRALAASRMTDS